MDFDTPAAPPNMADYDGTYRDFKFDIPEFFNFTTDVFEKWARDPARVALLVADQHGENITPHTFQELSRAANRFAQALLRRGVRKGDRVLVMLPRVPEWFAALLGMFKTGILPVPTATQCTPRDLLFRMENSKAAAILTDTAGMEKFEQIRGRHPEPALRCLVRGDAPADAQISPAPGWDCFHEITHAEPPEFTPPEKTRSSDPLLIYFTSGTVSEPKMVLHTQASYGIAHIVTAKYWHDLRPDDTHWTMTDTGWAKAAWGCLFGQWTIGARVFVHNCPRFEPKITLRLLSRAGITSFCAPPTVYRILVQEEELPRHSYPALRHCTSAGEPLNPEAIAVWRQATGLTIHDGYGQTETVNIIANYRCLPIKPGSMGKPAPGFKVAVIDDAGTPLPPGQEGEIAIHLRPRPVGLFREYFLEPESTLEALHGEWYRTGDRARVDEDGYFWFIGRRDDVILTAGYRIGPFEVESALIEHPAVREAAVVASPDRDRGEIVKAFVVLTPGHEPCHDLVLELQRHVRAITAPYKYPRKIEFARELPKTISGKIRRGELKAREWASISRE